MTDTPVITQRSQEYLCFPEGLRLRHTWIVAAAIHTAAIRRAATAEAGRPCKQGPGKVVLVCLAR